MLAKLLHCEYGATGSAFMHDCTYELRHERFAVLSKFTYGMHDNVSMCKLQACNAEAYHLQV